MEKSKFTNSSFFGKVRHNLKNYELLYLSLFSMGLFILCFYTLHYLFTSHQQNSCYNDHSYFLLWLIVVSISIAITVALSIKLFFTTVRLYSNNEEMPSLFWILIIPAVIIFTLFRGIFISIEDHLKGPLRNLVDYDLYFRNPEDVIYILSAILFVCPFLATNITIILYVKNFGKSTTKRIADFALFANSFSVTAALLCNVVKYYAIGQSFNIMEIPSKKIFPFEFLIAYGFVLSFFLLALYFPLYTKLGYYNDQNPWSKYRSIITMLSPILGALISKLVS